LSSLTRRSPDLRGFLRSFRWTEGLAIWIKLIVQRSGRAAATCGNGTPFDNVIGPTVEGEELKQPSIRSHTFHSAIATCGQFRRVDKAQRTEQIVWVGTLPFAHPMRA
jgi:hypothetical protein